MQVNLAYRWFCGLSIEDKIPDHSAFSRARHERFRDSDIFRRLPYGDLAMLRYTKSGAGALLVHHDDAEREVAYDREFRLSPLSEALDKATESITLVRRGP